MLQRHRRPRSQLHLAVAPLHREGKFPHPSFTWTTLSIPQWPFSLKTSRLHVLVSSSVRDWFEKHSSCPLTQAVFIRAAWHMMLNACERMCQGLIISTEQVIFSVVLVSLLDCWLAQQLQKLWTDFYEILSGHPGQDSDPGFLKMTALSLPLLPPPRRECLWT